MELLKLRTSDSEDLEQWLRRKDHHLHPEIQNEILQLINNEVLCDILSGMRDTADVDSPNSSMIINGTLDVSGDKQQSICVLMTISTFTKIS